MRITFQIALALLGLSALYVGLANLWLGVDGLELLFRQKLHFQPNTAVIVDKQMRILCGMWTAAGLLLLTSIPRFEENDPLLRLVFLGFALSSFGEFTAEFQQNGFTQSAFVKLLIQLGICTSMDYWRNTLQKRKTLQR